MTFPGGSDCYRFLFVVTRVSVSIKTAECETDAPWGSALGGQDDMKTGALKSFI